MYSEDVVISKLSSVNETQESIVSISQWILFHRRHAAQTVKTWSKALADASNHRKLALIYLANEVVQQSRARKKEEFLNAFAPTIAETIENAYRLCPPELQAKIRRVTEVWRQRTIFNDSVLNDLDSRLSDADKKKPKAVVGGRRLGQGTPFASSLPLELSKLVTVQSDVSSQTVKTGVAITAADKLYSTVTEADALPAPGEYAGQIETVLNLMTAAVDASELMLKARKEYISQLESLLSVNKAALKSETTEHAKLLEKKNKTVALQNEVREMLTESEPMSDKPEDKSGDKSPGDEEMVPDPVYTPLPANSAPAPAPDDMGDLDPAIAQFLSSLTPNETTAS
ncbi:RNA polymerase II-binding domain-containing protein [Lipomyces arxii]|uniref:RNA polymerase II-binding domain-containing protein n=1 Tax=Lipomyces arxii TaxID=56418 RepID=UPI0034CF5C3E